MDLTTGTHDYLMREKVIADGFPKLSGLLLAEISTIQGDGFRRP